MQESKLRIVVTGLSATYPFGGVFWDYMQYVLGFVRLGHDVLYFEDTGKWCYDPVRATFVESGANNADYLARQLASLHDSTPVKWFFRDAQGEVYGQTENAATDYCRHADLFVHLSASSWIREQHTGAARAIFIDSDPMYTQSSLFCKPNGAEKQSAIDWWRNHHDVFFTFAQNINSENCTIPRGPWTWFPTRQPIVLEYFQHSRVEPAHRRPVLTTVASWEPKEEGPVVNGNAYYGKSVEFNRFLDLPSRSALPIEIAISGPAPIKELHAHGWNTRPGYEVSTDPWVYRDYLAHSLAEWSVAKNAYVASRSGWFSCRSACYLALGVPTIVQDTGFDIAVPSGHGVLKFSDLTEAAACTDEVLANPDRHAHAAIELACEYFDSDRILTNLLENTFSADNDRSISNDR